MMNIKAGEVLPSYKIKQQITDGIGWVTEIEPFGEIPGEHFLFVEVVVNKRDGQIYGRSEYAPMVGGFDTAKVAWKSIPEKTSWFNGI